jgi:hypothetical protein
LLALLGLFEVGFAICGTALSSLALVFKSCRGGNGATLHPFRGHCTDDVGHGHRPRGRYTCNGFFSAALGSAFTSNVSWRRFFHINLPISGAAMFMALLAKAQACNDALRWGFVVGAIIGALSASGAFELLRKSFKAKERWL